MPPQHRPAAKSSPPKRFSFSDLADSIHPQRRSASAHGPDWDDDDVSSSAHSSTSSESEADEPASPVLRWAAEQRAKDLKVKGWTTDAALDSAKAAGDEARARLNRAERSVELTKNSLSYATLVADTRGVVTATMIEPGQVVAAGQASIRVARLGEKEAVVAIPETLLARARSGVATVTLWSDAKKTYAARLREVAPQADPATRTYLAKFSLPDADEAVSLGMTATLTLADKASERVAKLPLSALYSQGGDPSLYIVDDKGEVALKPVKVKAYESNNVVISGGVDDGAKVVALGVQKLDPSQKVRVVSSLSF